VVKGGATHNRLEQEIASKSLKFMERKEGIDKEGRRERSQGKTGRVILKKH